jgi:poly [ADP-ribose] polymerase
MKYAYLVMVETENNNNKFYEMIDQDNGTFISYNGRVDVSRVQQKPVSINEWDKVLRSKVKKGYVDVTELKTEKVVNNTTYLPITDPFVKKLINDLNKFSNQAILENYTVKVSQVTRAQIDEAQKFLDTINLSLSNNTINYEVVNTYLQKLFTVIPRKMKKVNDFLIHNQNDLKKLQDEQDLLDTLGQQVGQQVADDGVTQKAMDILDYLGLKVSYLTDAKTVRQIKDMCVGSFRQKVKNIYCVTNIKTQTDYDKELASSQNKKSELLWHGSRNENWLSILKNGLMIRPSGAVYTGSMYGDAIYLSDDVDKSGGYTSMGGSRWAGGNSNQFYMALYDAHLGNQKVYDRHDSSCYKLHDTLDKSKYDSVYAKPGISLRKSEYMIYKKEKCTVKYLIEFEN